MKRVYQYDNRHPREGGCQNIHPTDKLVVPAHAGTQEQMAEIPGFPLSRRAVREN
jgi:hypothetical protein